MNSHKIANFFKHSLLYIIIAAFLFRIYFFINHGVAWWDSSAYIGIGKNIFSGGIYGIDENFRPMLLPLILGFVWKIGINPFIFGMILDFTFNLASICLAYIIASKITNRRVGYIAAILMAISASFIFYSSRVLSENMAVFLTLLAVYFLLEKKYSYAGLTGGISVWVRYPQGLLLPAFLIFTLFIEENFYWKIKLKNSLKIFLWFIIPIAAIAIYNLVAFGNPLYQFSEAQNIIAKSGLLIPSPWYFYFGAVFAECFIAILIFYSFYLSLKEDKRNIWLLNIVFILFFAYYSTVARKEIRYLMVGLPFLYISVAYALENLYYKRLFGKHIVKYLVIGAIILVGVFSFFSIKSMNEKFYRPEIPDVMQNFYNSELIRGKTVISSSPVPVAYNDLKAIVMEQGEYYKYIDISSDYYMIYSCDFFCPDTDCRNRQKTFLSIINGTKKLVYKKDVGGCSYLLYENV